MLAQPEITQTDSARAVSAGHRLLGWSALRWAALAASFVLTIGVVVMNRALRHEELMRYSNEKPATPVSSTDGNVPQNIAEPQTPSVPLEFKAKTESITNAAAGSGKSFAQKKTRTTEARLGAVSRNQRFYDHMDKLAVQAEGQRGLIAATNSAPASPSAFPAEGPSNRPARVREQGQSTGATSAVSQGAAGGGSVSGSTVVTADAEAGANSSEMDRDWLRKQEPGRKKVAPEEEAMPAASAAAPQAPKQDSKAMKAQPTQVRSEAFSVGYKDRADAYRANQDLGTAGTSAIQWRIRGGKLQRSSDAGKTWQEMAIAPGITLHAFWTEADNVWAGGTSGALFHITEQGKRSDRIPIKVGDREITETVVAVTFTDQLHGTIMLEGGQILQTADSGRTWQRR
jgi:hypothetical protein